MSCFGLSSKNKKKSQIKKKKATHSPPLKLIVPDARSKAVRGNAPSAPFLRNDDDCLRECVDNEFDLNNYRGLVFEGPLNVYKIHENTLNSLYTMVSVDDICRRNFPGKEPYFILRGINSTDVHQGGFGTCVLLSILGAVANKGQCVVAKK